MGSDWIGALSAWAGDNTVLLLALIMLILATESLPVLGVVVPGFLLVLSLGAIVALTGVDPWLAWAAATAGCIAGDALLYGLGRRLRANLRSIWPLRHYPESVQRSEDFFHRYGALSLFLGRYLGPLRSFMPMIAGSLSMLPGRALPVIAVAAGSWVGVCMLPGMLLGASIELAAAYTTRLSLLLLLVLGSLWLLVWLVRAGYALAGRYNPWLLKRLVSYLRGHPRLGKWFLPLFNPTRGEMLSVAMLGLVHLVTFSVLIVLVLYVLIGQTPSSLDLRLAGFMVDLRNPVSDSFWTALVTASSGTVAALGCAALLVWLLGWRQYQAAIHWLLAVLPVPLLAWLLHFLVSRLPIWPPHLQAAGGFPALEASFLAAMLMAVPMLLVRELPAWQRKWYYLAVAVALTLLLIGRLALGLAWFSALIVAVLLALVWVTAVGIAYRARTDPGDTVWRHTLFAALVWLLIGSVYTFSQYREHREQWTVPLVGETQDFQYWWDQGWRMLPAWRSEYVHTPGERMNLQFAGPLELLQQGLIAADFETPANNPAAWWQALSPQPAPEKLPVFRLGYQGHVAELVMRKLRTGTGNGLRDRQIVVRLWPSGWRVRPDGRAGPLPVWLGSLSYEQPAARALFFNVWQAKVLPEQIPIEVATAVGGVCWQIRDAGVLTGYAPDPVNGCR